MIYLYRSHADLNVASFIASRNFFVPFPLFGLNATSFIADLISMFSGLRWQHLLHDENDIHPLKLIIYAMAVKLRSDATLPFQRKDRALLATKKIIWKKPADTLLGHIWEAGLLCYWSPCCFRRILYTGRWTRYFRAHVISLNTCRSARRLEREARAVPVKQNTHCACEKLRFPCLFLFSSQLLVRGEKCKISQQNVSIGG